MAIGGVAVGGAAIGLIASGGFAVGWHAALGGAGLAREFALGGGAVAHHANDDMARDFFTRYRWLDISKGGPRNAFWLACFAPMALQMAAWHWWQRKMRKHSLQS